MHNIIMEYIGKQRVPIGWVVAVIVGLFMAHQWADMHFITSAKGAETDKQMIAMIEENGTLIRDHLVEYDRNELAKEIKRVKNQQYEVKQFVAVNGPNELSNDRAEELRNELAELVAIQSCMNAGRKNCR